jgi:AcrR family transcriptional regulator
MPPRRAVRRIVRAVAAGARPKRRVRLDNDERRAQLLALARAAFSDRSYDDVSIDDLAREAKISKGLLYHYFPTKRDLYVAGLREIAEELVHKLTSVPTDLAPADRVRTSLDAYLDFVTQHSRAYVSLLRGGIGSDPEVAAVITGVRKRLAESFLDGSPLQPMLAGKPAFETSVRGWLGFVEHTVIDWLENQRMTRDQLRDLLSDVLLAIMRVVAPQLIS